MLLLHSLISGLSTKILMMQEKIVADFSNRFSAIKGAVIAENPQSTDYLSLVSLPGSTDCMVTRHNATRTDIYSWTGFMFKGEEFNAAAKKYRELYGKINGCIIKSPGGGKGYRLKGEYEKPTESMKFVSTIFELQSDKEATRMVKVELSMEFVFPEWQVKVMVYDKEDDDKIRPTEKEDE
jgi:hypothetical protein